jgi:mono/diheme cytochrome c family protein
MSERVPNILKGGEDSVGFAEAVQRVYLNIGSCAEQCWMNHIPDMRSVDPRQRNYGQTPVDIGQCRRDCASFRAIEDRLGDMVAFLLTARPTDLWQARGLSGPEELDRQLEEEFGAGAVERGRQVFAGTCARCHSSQFEPYENLDFREVDANDPTLRIDWLSNGLPVAASRVGTNPGRALHSNHMPSRVWDEYAARDLAERPVDAELPEVLKGSGRGYYRPVSLLSVWAHAPLMHNNGIGPEICGKTADPELDFYESPYVDAAGRPLADPPACWPFDPSVEGRWKLFRTSIEVLLYPERRVPKMFLTAEDIIVDAAPDLSLAGIEAGFSLRVPKGTPAIMLSSLRYKDLIQDLVLIDADPERLAAKYAAILAPQQFEELSTGLAQLRGELVAAAARFELDITKEEVAFVQRYYSNVLDRLENGGHLFGTDLTDAEKQALIAYLATL